MHLGSESKECSRSHVKLSCKLLNMRSEAFFICSHGAYKYDFFLPSEAEKEDGAIWALIGVIWAFALLKILIELCKKL